MILVVWCDVKGSGPGLSVADQWQAFECPNEAAQFYERIRQRPGTYNANICGVIESTDYGPTPEKQAGAVRRELTRGLINAEAIQ